MAVCRRSGEHSPAMAALLLIGVGLGGIWELVFPLTCSIWMATSPNSSITSGISPARRSSIGRAPATKETAIAEMATDRNARGVETGGGLSRK